VAESFLPPAVLDMIVNAAEWTGGLDDAIESAQAGRDAIEEVTAAAGDMAVAMGASADAVSASMGEAAGAAGVYADAAGRLRDANGRFVSSGEAAADTAASVADGLAAVADAAPAAAGSVGGVAEAIAAAAEASALSSEPLAAYNEKLMAAAEMAGDLSVAQAELKASAAELRAAVADLAGTEAAAGKDSDEYAAQLNVVADAMLRQQDAAYQLRITTEAAAAQTAASGAAADAAAGQAAALGDAEAAAGAKAAAAGDEQEAASAKAAGGLKLWGLAAVAGIAISVKMAGDFQQSMTRLVTSAGETQGNLGMVSQGILAMSSATNTSTSQLASGMYQVESAGFHGAAGLTVLKAAAEGAQAEQADLAEVTNAVTSGLVAYGMKASQATSFTNQMVTTVGQGKMTMQDLAQSLSAVLPIAASYKISFAQVGGALATMTAMGMSAKQGTQDLAATIRSLGNPTSVATNEMSEFGIKSTQVSQMLGNSKIGLSGTISYLSDEITSKMGKSGLVLVNAMNQSKSAAADAQTMLKLLPKSVQAISKSYLDGSTSYTSWYNATKGAGLVSKTMADQFAAVAAKANGFNSLLASGAPAAQTYSAAMAKMLGGATGLNVGLMLTGVHAKTFDDNVKAIAESANGAGANVKGWALIQSNFNFQLGSAEKAVQAMAISFGAALLPAATKVIHILGEAAGWLAKNAEASRVLAVVIGVLLAGALEHGLVKALKACTSGLGEMTGGIKGAVGFFRAGEGEASQFSKIMGGIGSAASSTGSAVASAWSGTMSTLGSTWSAIAGAASKTASGISSAWSASMSGISTASSATWSGITSAWSGAGSLFSSAASSVASFSATAVSKLRTAAAATGAWVAEHAVAAGTYIAENVAMAASATAAFIAENAATLGLIAGIALLVAGIVYLALHWKQAWGDVKKWALDAWHFIDGDVIHPVQRGIADLVGWIQAHWKLLAAILGGPLGAAAVFIATHWKQIVGIFERGSHDVNAFLARLPAEILAIFRDAGSWLLDAGRNVIMGLVHGIEDMASAPLHAIEDVGHDVIGAAKDVLSIFSPSKVFYEIGSNITTGMALGIGETRQQAVEESRRLGQEVAQAAASGSITAQEADQLSAQITTALSSAERSLAAKAAATAKVSQELGLKMQQGLLAGIEDAATASEVKTAVGKLITIVQEAWSAGMISASKASALTAWLEKDNSRLQALAAQRASIASQIAAAKSYAATTASGVSGAYGLSSSMLGSKSGTLTSVKGIIGNLGADLKQIRAFKTNLLKLGRMGLNKNYLAQIVAMGPVDGGALAAELAAANPGQIHQVNAAESAISGLSGQIGKQAADEMYDTGKDAGKGFLSGLEAQQAAITQVMNAIAKSMVTTLKKELGIASPSKVFYAHGAAIGQGLALGITSQTAQVGRAMKGLSAATSLTGTRSTVPAGVLSAGGSQPITINLHSDVTGKLDNETVWRAQQTETLRYNIRNSGQVTGAVKPGLP
jgi:TP901 family phage tail tape measure protein